MEPNMTAKQILERIQEASVRGDMPALLALWAEDIELEFPGYGTLKGRDAAGRVIGGFYSAFPDMQVTILNQCGTDTFLMTEFEETGTMKNPLTLPDGSVAQATGRGYRLKGVHTVEVKDGLLQSSRFYIDMAPVYAQIGVQLHEPQQA